MRQQFQTQRQLSEFTTFGIGGPARYFIEVDSVEKMQQLIQYCASEKLPYFILGKGSNCLFADQGFDGLVILNKIHFCEIQDPCVHVGAGYSFALLGVQTARKQLSGLEFASGIPASVGGAVYMNAGASAQSTADHLIHVDYIDEQGILHKLHKRDLTFRYRFSSFQEERGAIVGATFVLDAKPDARSRQVELVEYRTKTQPYQDLSAGCIFRNPTGGHAGQLIEACGLKGLSVGGAAVSLLHANFIVNRGDASAADVLALVDLVKQRVKAEKGVELEMEVRYVQS